MDRQRCIILPLLLLLVLTSLWSCHGDEPQLVDPDGPANPSLPIGMQSQRDSVFLKLRFNVPAYGEMTRSGLTDGTDPGVAGEYAFHDGLALLFQANGADEADATLHSAYVIPTLGTLQSEYENLWTGDYIVAMSRKKVELLKTSDMRLLVLLNVNDQFYVNNEDLYTAAHEKLTGLTLDDFSKLICNNIGSAATGFMMANAPMLNKTDGAVQTLSPVKAVFFSQTAAHDASLEKGATTVIVERAAAKVTLTLGTNPLQRIYIDGADDRWASLGTVTWTVDNQNTAFRVVRQADAAWASIGYSYAKAGSRFVYGVPTEGLYRLQWGRDVNYDNYTGDHSGTTGTDSWDNTRHNGWEYLTGVCTAAAIDQPCTTEPSNLYICENTVSERCLTWYNTTRVVVAVQLLSATKTPLSGFYTAGVTGMNNIYTTEAKLREALADWFDDQVGLNKDLLPLISILGTNLFDAAVTTIAVDATTHQVSFTIDTSASIFTGIDATKRDDALAALTALITTGCYQFDDRVYYASYIAHFGSNDTPWNKETHAPFTTTKTDTYDHTYYNAGDDADLVRNFFGRWSVVRDHWYKLTLHSISLVGSPVVPDPDPSTPDDQVNNPLTIVPGFPLNYDGETPQW